MIAWDRRVKTAAFAQMASTPLLAPAKTLGKAKPAKRSKMDVLASHATLPLGMVGERVYACACVCECKDPYTTGRLSSH